MGKGVKERARWKHERETEVRVKVEAKVREKGRDMHVVQRFTFSNDMRFIIGRNKSERKIRTFLDILNGHSRPLRSLRVSYS